MYEHKLTLKVGEGKISMHGNEGGMESLRDKIKGGQNFSAWLREQLHRPPPGHK